MMGPVQMLIVGFDQPDFQGEIMAEIERLRDSDTIRLLDLILVRKTAEGDLELLHERDEEGMTEFGATVGALIGFGVGGEEGATIGAVRGAELAAEGGEGLDDPDVWYAADAIPNDTAAAVALIEHRWAIGLRDSIVRANGFHLADAWIHPRDLVAVGLAEALEEEAEAAS
jgi:uncharacterized membrane protein